MLRRAWFLTALAVLPLSALTIWAVVRPPGTVVSRVGAGPREPGEIAVRAYTWGFSPRVIRVDPGAAVRFAVVSDDLRHGFAINELGVNLQLVPGQEGRSPSVTVNLPPGRYTIQCSVFCGLGHASMKATLVVGDPGPSPGQILPWLVSAVSLAAVAAFAVVTRVRRRHDGEAA